MRLPELVSEGVCTLMTNQTAPESSDVLLLLSLLAVEFFSIPAVFSFLQVTLSSRFLLPSACLQPVSVAFITVSRSAAQLLLLRVQFGVFGVSLMETESVQNFSAESYRAASNATFFK